MGIWLNFGAGLICVIFACLFFYSGIVETKTMSTDDTVLARTSSSTMLDQYGRDVAKYQAEQRIIFDSLPQAERDRFTEKVKRRYAALGIGWDQISADGRVLTPFVEYLESLPPPTQQRRTP